MAQNSSKIIANSRITISEKEVEEGRFREDLYYRLAMVPIIVPPLRERMEDLPLLVNHIIKRYRKTFKKELIDISPDAMGILLNYHWPGNIRELEGILEYSFIKGKGNFITPGDLPLRVLKAKEILKTRSNTLYQNLCQAFVSAAPGFLNHGLVPDIRSSTRN